MDDDIDRFVELACALANEVWTEIETLRFLWQFDPAGLPEEERVYLLDVLRALPERNLHLVCLVSPHTAHLVEQELLGWPFYTDFMRAIRDGDLSSPLNVAYQQAVLAAVRLSSDEWQHFIRNMLSTEKPSGAIASPLVKIGPVVGSRPDLSPPEPERASARPTRAVAKDWVAMVSASASA